jgi:hypothetical protein
LKIAEMRRKGAEDAAKRIKEEDEADAKKEKAALAEEEKKAKQGPDYTISTSKLDEIP